MPLSHNGVAMGQAYNGNARPSGVTALLPTLAELLHATPQQRASVDVAVANMLCATGLPGSEGLDVRHCLATLERWADSVRRYTRDALGEYQREPDRFQRHKGFFLFLSMASLLKHPRGLGVRYQPTAVGNFDFADSRDDLIHGLLTRRMGTCTSFPALFVAIGRRLGWPLHLAVAKGHVLCQWVSQDGGRVNLEGSCGGGGDLLPDSHYHRWPRPMTADDLATGNYLRPLTREEEFALFLETRGHCLTDNGRYGEAREAYGHAYRIAPQFSQHEGHLHSVRMHEGLARRKELGGGVAATPLYLTVNAPVPNRALFPTITSIPGFISRTTD